MITQYKTILNNIFPVLLYIIHDLMLNKTTFALLKRHSSHGRTIWNHLGQKGISINENKTQEHATFNLKNKQFLINKSDNRWMDMQSVSQNLSCGHFILGLVL